MPTYTIKLKADLENIKQLISNKDNIWKFDVESSDGMETKKGVTVSRADVLEIDGSRGTANYVMKWPESKSQAYMVINDVKGVSGNYTEENSGKWVTLFAVECRGLKPTAWYPEIDFNAESTGGFVFEDVDLTSREWAEYDEENDLSVSIMNVESKVE